MMAVLTCARWYLIVVLNQWCWAFSHVPLGHLYDFFGEMSIQAFYPFLIGFLKKNFFLKKQKKKNVFFKKKKKKKKHHELKEPICSISTSVLLWQIENTFSRNPSESALFIFLWSHSLAPPQKLICMSDIGTGILVRPVRAGTVSVCSSLYICVISSNMYRDWLKIPSEGSNWLGKR